jgi:hypothetical protein
MEANINLALIRIRQDPIPKFRSKARIFHDDVEKAVENPFSRAFKHRNGRSSVTDCTQLQHLVRYTHNTPESVDLGVRVMSFYSRFP